MSIRVLSSGIVGNTDIWENMSSEGKGCWVLFKEDSGES